MNMYRSKDYNFLEEELGRSVKGKAGKSEAWSLLTTHET